MRLYEAVYILDPSLDEDQQNGFVERFRSLVETQGATVQHLERWERRRLAYEVKGRREGYYVVMNFRGEPAAEAELGRVLGITDSVIRHMIVKMDERTAERSIADAKAAQERAQAEAEAKAAEAAAAEAAAREAAAAAAAQAPAPAAPAPAAPVQAEPAQAEPASTEPASAEQAQPAPEPTDEETQAGEKETGLAEVGTGTEE
jgi:small subunit ribosomal protein S6